MADMKMPKRRRGFPDCLWGVLPEETLGCAEVRHVELTKEDVALHNVRAYHAAGGLGSLDTIAPGRYVQLLVHGQLAMSDTRMERMTNRDFLWEARGDVLVTGLGLGMILFPLFSDESVTSITVIEKVPDVIALVGKRIGWPHRAKLEIECADALEWRPPKGQKWDTVYHDIWPNRCVENLEEIATLKRRFARRLKPGGWQGAWIEDLLRVMRRRAG